MNGQGCTISLLVYAVKGISGVGLQQEGWRNPAT
jgi:hypothetical protein